MHSDQIPYRALYEAMLSYDGGALHDDLLRPWLAAHDGERRWLDAVRTRAPLRTWRCGSTGDS